MGVTVRRGRLSPVEGDRGHGAALGTVLDADVGAPAAHQVAGDREAEARALRAAAAGPPAVEAVEHRLELRRVEARAVVDDGDGARGDHEADVAAAVVQRVLDTLVENALQYGGGAARRGPAGDRERGDTVGEARRRAAGGVAEVDLLG